MSYVIVLTTTALGVLGVLFSRRNPFNILQPLSQILLWLIVLAGIAAVVDVAYKDDAITAADKRVHLVEERTQNLALKPFDLSKPPTTATFVIAFDNSGSEPSGLANFIGPFPTYGRAGRFGRISVALADTFAVHAEMTAEADRVRFTETDADGRALREGEAGPWFAADTASGIHGAELKSQSPLARILSAIKANGLQPLGTLAFDIPNTPQTRTFVALAFEKIVPSFKFHLRQETPYQPCTAIVTVPMRLEIDPPRSETRMTATLRLVEREALSIACEKTSP
jgi:hypothetical protein